MRPEFTMAWSTWPSPKRGTSATTAGLLRMARSGIMIAALLSLLYFSATLAFSSLSSSTTLYDVSRSARSKLNIVGLKDNLGQIFNDTLGFQKVYAINLPERTDKRDAILLQAKLTNFSVEFVDGVLGTDVSPKALPHTFNQGNGTIGSWRAHLNSWSRMIEENIQSALILEDDADWDVGLKSQLTEFARGSRWLLESNGKARQTPYGNDWDILWIGHCTSVADPTDNRRWVIPHDPTVPPQGTRWNFAQPDMSPWEQGNDPDPQSRIVYTQEYGWCISGYALTLRAAKRLLYVAGLVPFNYSLDGWMGEICRRGHFPDFTCIAPFPRLIGVGRGAGLVAKYSDIQGVDPGNEEAVLESDQTENVMFSVRHNLNRLLNSEPTFESFFPNPSGDLLTLDEITRARGHPEHIELAPENGQGEQGAA